MKKSRDFASVLRRKLDANPALKDAVEEQAFNANIAQQIYDLRVAAGLTQTQLAKKAKTHQSVIARLEDSDYDGHSLPTLRKIARALGRKIALEFYADCAPLGDELHAEYTVSSEYPDAMAQVTVSVSMSMQATVTGSQVS